MKLKIELVPSSSWFDNVRSFVTKKQWDLIRNKVYTEAWNVCQICGDVGSKHPVECHEIWHYDDSKLIQKLIGMIALCPDCHMVKHYGLASMEGKRELALAHFMKVNKLKKEESLKYIKEAFTKWAERSEKNWEVDISILEYYGIDVDK